MNERIEMDQAIEDLDKYLGGNFAALVEHQLQLALIVRALIETDDPYHRQGQLERLDEISGELIDKHIHASGFYGTAQNRYTNHLESLRSKFETLKD